MVLHLIRLLGIDIDGTLLDSNGRLLPANRDAIVAAVAAGVQVVLVTGRSYPFARPVVEPLPDSVSLIVSNGAIERRRDGHTLSRRLLPRTTAATVLDRTRAFRHCAAVIFDREHERQIMAETMDWTDPNREGYYARNRAFIDSCVPLELALVEDPVEVMFNGPVEEMRRLAARLDGAGEFTVSMTEYESRDFTLLDVTSVQATKGRALAERAAALGLTSAEVMAVGDNYNDIEMLEFAGCAVVMGNAVDELKRRGWNVTESNDAAGVARAIERFVLAEGVSPPRPRDARSPR